MAFVSSFSGAWLRTAPYTTQSHSVTTATAKDASTPAITRRAALATICAGSAALLAPTPSLADRTVVAARRSLDRYYPRMVDGIEMLRSIKQRVSAGEASTIGEISDSKLFDIKLRRAFSIYATSFSDNYLGQRSRNLLACVDGFYGELAKVKNATEKEDAIEHYNLAVQALEKYFSIARLPTDAVKGLSL